MVKMIPDSLAPEIKSAAEAKLFMDFRNTETDEDYIILHSLGVSEHSNNIFGEIDFVVICHRGVLCIEVKGGEVSRSQGIWSFMNRYGVRSEKRIGPFQQVQANMHSLRDYLSRRLGKEDPLVSCQYASCVIMPECHFTYEAIDIIPEILFDNLRYHGLEETAERSFDYWTELLEEKHGFSGSGLSLKEMERLANLLRGDFKFVPLLKTTLDNTAKALTALTDEQYDVLESLSENERVLVSGAAGTGKTLLAIEQASRMFWSGKRVLYLCFNRNIADYVQYRFDREKVDVESKTLHAVLQAVSGIKKGDYPESSYFENELPERFLELPDTPVYDYIVIDEGQDLFRELYLACIDRLVRGGLQGGNWIMFYDPNQNLYNRDSGLNESLQYLKRYAVSFKLSVNCRNTKQILNASLLMTDIYNTGTARVSGPEAKYIAYDGHADEHRKLENVIQELKSEGLSGSDMIILSRYSIDNEKNCLYCAPLSYDVGVLKIDGEMWRAKKNEIRFSTIAAFKGLEARAVVLIDVDAFSRQSVRLLNYVAISRASVLLYILYDADKKTEWQDVIRNAAEIARDC